MVVNILLWAYLKDQSEAIHKVQVGYIYIFTEHFDACKKRIRKDRTWKSQTDLGLFVTKTPQSKHGATSLRSPPNDTARDLDFDKDLLMTGEQQSKDM